MVSNIFMLLTGISIIALFVFAIAWIIKKVLHKHFWQFLTGWIVLASFIAVPVLAFATGATMTPAQQAAQDKQDKADAASEKREKLASEKRASAKKVSESKVASSQRTVSSEKAASASKKRAANKTASSKAKVASEAKASSKAAASSKAKASSERIASSKAKSVSESKAKKASAKKESSKKSDTKQTGLNYKYVSLSSITEDPYKYDSKLIKTSGTVMYIQKNPDDKNMYYVVIAPKDKYSSSGYSEGHGSVTEIDIDTMEATPIHEGDHITVYGSVLENTVTLNGKDLKTDIIVDRISK
ncbi:hypothetical protein [Lactiplantibacillus daowaiensis]|uniref:TcdA-E operon negative regulator n=1 Tax=Lactiplantibacillus daowaiensis TaxID=2559918 RepID=A0ABW1RXQ7_9LACO|nr:hypothetical protein [Lactiplantibacillus daowaiensis]